MKKVIAFLLAAVMLLTILPTAFAVTAGVWNAAPELQLKAAKSGTTVTVELSAKTDTSLASLEFKLAYDAEKLTVIGDANEGTGIYEQTFGARTYPTISVKDGVISYAAARNANADFAADAAIFTAEFTVKSGDEFEFTASGLKAGNADFTQPYAYTGTLAAKIEKPETPAEWTAAPEIELKAVRSGNTVTVSVTPKTATALTAFEFDLTYDAARLTAVGDDDAKTGIYGLTFGTGCTPLVNLPEAGVLAYAAARTDNYSVAAGAAVAAMQFTIGEGHAAEEFIFALTKLKAGTHDGGLCKIYAEAERPSVTVPAKDTATISDIQDLSKTYDGTAVSKPTYTYVGDGEVTVTWYSADGTAKLSAAPKAAGSYQVGVKASETDGYTAAAEVKKAFTIGKKTLTPALVSGSVDGKRHDGTTATTGGQLTVSGVVAGDEVTVSGSIVWTSAAIGTTTVNVSDITLSGAEKDNYELSATSLLNVESGHAILKTYTLGDVDDDGDIDAMDASQILRYCVKKGALPVYAAGDVDKNGDVNAQDASLILRHCVRDYTIED